MKTKSRRVNRKQRKGGFIGPLLSALAPLAVNLIGGLFKPKAKAEGIRGCGRRRRIRRSRN
jgi:hypothetical protein